MFEQLKVGIVLTQDRVSGSMQDRVLKLPRINGLTVRIDTWWKILEMWDQMKTTHSVQMSLASSPLDAGSSTTENEILLGSCWDPCLCVPLRNQWEKLQLNFYQFHVHVHVFIPNQRALGALSKFTCEQLTCACCGLLLVQWSNHDLCSREFQFFLLPGTNFVFFIKKQGKFLDFPFSFLVKNLINFFFWRKMEKRIRRQIFLNKILSTTANK